MTSHHPGGGGGMTGATGDLTPDTTDDAFVPGELREVADPDEQARMTREQGAHAPSQQGEIGDPEAEPTRPPTNLANRDEGYGSTHGLRGDDPAYRMEGRGFEPARRPEQTDRTVIGGDELTDEEERF